MTTPQDALVDHDVLDELHRRGLIAQSTDEEALRTALDSSPSPFDPTRKT